MPRGSCWIRPARGCLSNSPRPAGGSPGLRLPGGALVRKPSWRRFSPALRFSGKSTRAGRPHGNVRRGGRGLGRFQALDRPSRKNWPANGRQRLPEESSPGSLPRDYHPRCRSHHSLGTDLPGQDPSQRFRLARRLDFDARRSFAKAVAGQLPEAVGVRAAAWRGEYYFLISGPYGLGRSVAGATFVGRSRGRLSS